MPEIVIPQRFAQRRDTTANWTSRNPILWEGEIGFIQEEVTLRVIGWKVGDGVTPWNTLPEFTTGGGTAYIDMRVDSGWIQFQNEEDGEWFNLIAIADLKGDPGEDSTVPGPPGPAGGPSGVIENTGAVTIDAPHKNNWLLQSSGDVTFPVPSSIGFIDGDFVNVRRQAGTVGFVAGTGATLDFNDTLFSPSINALKDSVAVVAHGDAWMLVGPLEAL